ncbi:MAG: PDZ domain-containing protein [Phycisphaerales bacterium]|nr:MAG: PDZ domain-containing protein [Phycisphaerales bacterium]
MNMILAGLLIGLLPQVVLPDGRVDDDPDVQVKADVYVLTGDEEGVVRIKGGEGSAQAFAIVSTGDGDDEGRTRRRVISKSFTLGDSDDADKLSRGWLGVTIAEVPDAVAAQASLQGGGIIVQGVVEDGPADKAGIEEHDIIIAIDGAELTGRVGQAVAMLGLHRAGEDVDIKVLREGVEKTFSVTLKARSEMPEIEIAIAPLAEIEDELRTRGGIIHRGPGGKWELKDLGEIIDLDDLPESIKKFIPKMGDRTIQVWADDEGKTKRTLTIARHGDTDEVTIKQEGDGEIVVERPDSSGNKTTTVYATPDELREGDPDAFELYDGAAEPTVIDLDLEGLGDFDLDIEGLGDLDIEFDVEDLADHFSEWQEHLGEGLAGALEEVERQMEEIRERMDEWKADPRLPSSAHPVFEGLHSLGKPQQSFEVRVDGTIEVRIRKGDSELVRLFADEADLKRREPNLFEKFQDLMSTEE